MSRKATRLLKLPPVKWEQAAKKLTSLQATELSRELDGLAAQAAMLSAYLGNQPYFGHKKAVKKMNSITRKVRRVLGYHITHDLNI